MSTVDIAPCWWLPESDTDPDAVLLLSADKVRAECSLAAFLNGGVVIRSSNLAVEGEVQVRAQAMGHSAARIAAKQHSIFHGQKKSGEP